MSGNIDMGGCSICNIGNSSLTFCSGAMVVASEFGTDGKALYAKGFSVAGGSVSVTGDGVTATVTQTAHGYITDQTITIAGTTNFDGAQVITRTGDDTYTFASASSAGPKAGTATPLDPWSGAAPTTIKEAVDRIVVALTSHLGVGI